MKIYIIPSEIANQADKSFEELTDEEVLDLLKDKSIYDYDLFTNLKDFQDAWNDERMFSNFTSYMRVIND